MSLKDKNNPLGQRKVSDKVGDGIEKLSHEQSGELVDKVREKADRIEGQNIGRKPKTDPQPGTYDRGGPDRQPGRVAKQPSKPGNLHPQEGQYTQDNEEEEPNV